MSKIPMPSRVDFCGPVASMLEQAAVLVRSGYVFVPEEITVFTSSGHISFALVPGDPSRDATKAAGKTLNDAREIESARQSREEKEAARAASEAVRLAHVQQLEQEMEALRHKREELLKAPA